MLHAFETFGINIFEVAEDSLRIQLLSHKSSAAKTN